MAQQGVNQLALASQLEQFETAIEQFAPVVGSYYQSLIANGIPEKLASTLVQDWHTILWASTIFLNERK